MDNKNFNGDDAYDELLDLFGDTRKNEYDSGFDDEVKNHGEIYFSANSHKGKTVPEATHKSVRTSNMPETKKYSGKAASAAGAKTKRRPAKKKKKTNNAHSLLLAVIVVIFSIFGAFMLRAPIMGCINDILAINVSSTDYRVVIKDGMTIDDVINLLAEKKLINNPTFCKLFTSVVGYDKKRIYPPGTYFLNSGMGVEGMLYKISHNDAYNTVMLTFPEGYTVEQTIKKLSDNGVAAEKALYDVLKKDDMFKKFTFLADIKDKEKRYNAFEGYLYPDTYDFYLGEDPKSVIEKFLKNFEEKWNETYAARATELGFTMDEIINIASILQKEAKDSKQMPIIASVIYNRFRSSSFPFINCDATADYIKANEKTLKAMGSYAEYMSLYDTYQKTGLPIGPICCPGNDAIYSALYPDTTDYYYFVHAPDGAMYPAKTEAEHEANKKKYLK